MAAVDLKSLFGTAVKTKRAELAISQEELADRSGLHRTYISDVERGTRNLSLESIEKLAQALGLSVGRLFERANGASAPAEPVEILLVEDSRADEELTLRAFRQAKFTNPVQVVRDGAEALEYLFATGAYAGRRGAPPPQMILLDLKLPKVSGLEVLRRMKRDPHTRAISVVVLTASDRDHDIAECRRLGAEAYLVKPVALQNLSQVTPGLSMEWALIKR